MIFKLLAGFVMLFTIQAFVSSAIEGGGGLVVTRLTANLAKDGATAAVASTTGFLNAGYIQISGEEIYYSAKTATTFTLTGTHKAAASGVKVMSPAAGAVNSLVGFDVGATSSTVGNIKVFLGLGSALTYAIPKIIAWNYSYLDNDIGTLIKFFILWPLSAGFAATFMLSFIAAIRGILLP